MHGRTVFYIDAPSVLHPSWTSGRLLAAVYLFQQNFLLRLLSMDVENSLDEASVQSRKNQQGKSTIYVLGDVEEHAETYSKAIAENGSSIKATAEIGGPSHSPQTCKPQKRYISNGGTNMASLFTKQGHKGTNQDTMLVIEKFVSHHNTTFGGVFDGHGRHGHLVARHVRDVLPEKLKVSWQDQHQAAREGLYLSDYGDLGNHSLEELTSKHVLIDAWKEAFRTAFKLTDRELLVNDTLDCFASGTTAVVVVRQGNDLLVGNVGDSRAILGARDDDGSLLAIQLTVDSKPDEPREAERIKRYDGRVFALQREPSVHRVWLPHRNAPGLAMSRALGDYCLKNNGLISVPEVTYRRLTKRDEFVVLATDGVWDVLSNEDVAAIVASTPNRAFAARAVVEHAVHVWRSKYAHWRVDDCAVVCLFL
ncbi:hypothetical protein GOP47_0007047 [Adiantum capillus-veneris]|uniref:PPM-type phosphatase domain-containing protein n=1 Tax=Adiantum capillus-veneris TaxID=13818 RepID=A0A9D4V0U5_ADICA|nr:hypothetical protein GOP47_0007047 [Adiantum capillus-veneris]